jgi:hypothetical protein
MSTTTIDDGGSTKQRPLFAADSNGCGSVRPGGLVSVPFPPGLKKGYRVETCVNCLYSAEQAEDCSEPICSGGDLSDMSNKTTTASASSQPASPMVSSQKLPSSVMSEHSSVTGTPRHIREWLMSLQPAFHASPSALQESEKEELTSETCGPPQSSAFAWFDRDTHYWRTFQVSLFTGISGRFLGRWPKAGTLHLGVCYQQLSAERRIREIDSGLWPTARAIDAHGIETSLGSHAKYSSGMTLSQKARLFPTPTVADPTGGRTSKGSKRPNEFGLAKLVKLFPTPNTTRWATTNSTASPTPTLFGLNGGKLNPTWVEWLMGFPLGWTDLQPLAMDKFQQWCELHGIYFTNVEETQMDAFDRYDEQPGRRYLALEIDTPSRWQNFATSHPEFKWIRIVAPVHINCYCVPSVKES